MNNAYPGSRPVPLHRAHSPSPLQSVQTCFRECSVCISPVPPHRWQRPVPRQNGQGHEFKGTVEPFEKSEAGERPTEVYVRCGCGSRRNGQISPFDDLLTFQVGRQMAVWHQEGAPGAEVRQAREPPLTATVYTHPSDQEIWQRIRGLTC
jgi:hypothetical protein